MRHGQQNIKKCVCACVCVCVREREREILQAENNKSTMSVIKYCCDCVATSSKPYTSSHFCCNNACSHTFRV